MPNGNCPNKNKAIASFVTNATDPARSSWDLRPYKTAGIAKPGSTWRIIETGAMLQYYSGKVSADGTLVSYDYQEPVANAAMRSSRAVTESSLPDYFYSNYSYDGYMELQIDPPPEEPDTDPCDPTQEICCSK